MLDVAIGVGVGAAPTTLARGTYSLWADCYSTDFTGRFMSICIDWGKTTTLVRGAYSLWDDPLIDVSRCFVFRVCP